MPSSPRFRTNAGARSLIPSPAETGDRISINATTTERNMDGNDNERGQMPGHAWRWQTRDIRGQVEPRLVAEPAEPGHPAPALGRVQPDGPGLQLRRGVQEARSGRAEEGPLRADDRLAGLVAGRLGPLRRRCSSAWPGTAPAPTAPATAAAAPAPATSVSRRSTAGPTTATSTRRAACSGRSSRNTATRSPGPT